MTAKKGFTLIELLIVIAILGVLAAGVVTAINPVKRTNQANDAKIKSNINSLGTAAIAYFTLRRSYPSTLGDLVTSGDIKVVPDPPLSYTAYAISIFPSGCSTACTDIAISGQIKVPAVVGNTLWCWHSNTGVVAEGTTCTAP